MKLETVKEVFPATPWRYNSNMCGGIARSAKPYFGETIALCCIFLFSGCAGNEISKREEANEKRFALLNEQLNLQADRIERLTNALEKAKTVPTSQSAPVTPSGIDAERTAPPLVSPNRVPLKKLIPAEDRAEDEDEEEDPFAEEGSSIADSSQQTMHWYYEGNRFLKRQQYDDAVKAFQHFLRSSPDHVYSDRAQYLIANCYFKNKEYGQAILATNSLESAHPQSFRIPDALFARAESYGLLGQTEDARTTFRDLLKRFPSDPLADKASRKLAELGIDASPDPVHTPLLLDDSD